MTRAIIFKCIFLPLSLFGMILHASALENTFSTSQLKKIKVVVIVIGGIGATYAVYKVGEYTVKVVKAVYRKYREYKRNELFVKIQQGTENLKEGALGLSEITELAKRNTHETGDLLSQVSSTKQNTLNSLNNVENNFDHSKELSGEISEKNEEALNLLRAFHKSAKTSGKNFSGYSAQKKITRNEEKMSLNQYQNHSIQTKNIGQSCATTQTQCKNSNLLSCTLDTQNQNLSETFNKRLSTDLDKED